MWSIEQRFVSILRDIANSAEDRRVFNFTDGQGNPLPRFDSEEPMSVGFIKFHGITVLKDIWLASDKVSDMPWCIRLDPTYRINDLHEPMKLLREAGVYCLATMPVPFWIRGQHDKDGQLMCNEVWFFTEADMVLGAAMFAQYGG